MRTPRKMLAIALCAGLISAGAPVANAAIAQQPSGFEVTNPVSETGGIVSGLFEPGAWSSYTFLHPASGVQRLNSELYFLASMNRQVAFDPGTTTLSKHGDTMVFVTRDDQAGAEVTREITVRGNAVDVTVAMKNTGSSPAWANLDIIHQIRNWPETLQARTDASDAISVAPSSGQGYEVTAEFDGAERASAAGTVGDFVTGSDAISDARVQGGEWRNTQLAPGETLRAAASFTTRMLPGALDRDGDGLLDEWETRGYPLHDGTVLPLNRWGADPDRKDVFLQLNWMNSEWEDQGCDRVNRYAASGPELEKFLACSELNTNSYRPSIATLTKLEDLFADHDIALHIDAGELYKSADMIGYSETHGGKTESYREGFFSEGENRGLALQDLRDELLGDRAGVFYAGLIGDKKAEGERSSGEGLVKDGAFFVAKGAGLNSQDLLAKTILHEFGHNLGLSHYGINGRPAGVADNQFLPNYKSSMNYLYQFREFNFSEGESRNAASPVEICRPFSCFTGNYSVPADWESLDFHGYNKGINVARRYVEDSEVQAPEPEIHNHDETVRELAIAAADKNEGKAGFELSTTDDSGIVTMRNDNVLHGKLTNLGLDVSKFTVTTRFENGGSDTQTIVTPGVLKEGSTTDVRIPVPNAAALRGPKTRVAVEIRNDKRELVYSEYFDVSVLDYTKAEADKALKELENSNASKKMKDKARARLSVATTPKPSLTTSSAQPVPTQKPTASAVPAPQKQNAKTGSDAKSESGSSTGGILAIILAVLGLLGAGAYAVTQGYVQIPGLNF